MKKILSIILCLSVLSCFFTGCTDSETKNNSNEKISIVTTIFPEYDWTRNIIGENSENTELTMLIDSGVDLHSYQPTAQDILKISTCDMFIYVGGASDAWVDDALKEKTNPNMVVIDLLDVLGNTVREEETVEGMEAEKEEAEEEGPEYDEHVWLSLKNAEILCKEIASGLSQVDPDNAEKYSTNEKAYSEKLAALDGEYQSAVDSAKVKTLVFGDRFPFRYLVDDYGISYYAAFVGCSAESEASFETITFLAGKIDELKLTHIMQIESSDGSIANTVKQNTKTKDQTILKLNSIQTVTADNVKDGADYLDIMQSNLAVLKEALN